MTQPAPSRFNSAVEFLPSKQDVAGSNPAIWSIFSSVCGSLADHQRAKLV